ncbi:tyrosine-protein kinase STYK1 [Erpetoichthys calabaricus]|uniref:tyrosine-protein kinase STYK1 n=1 Tax=Erpetoichthys calabaricus TaxID=27687 RepID=UPI0022342337|nr:tyrosine-protein kinase STYK1 [Erpetoichthys calabaricus]
MEKIEKCSLSSNNSHHNEMQEAMISIPSLLCGSTLVIVAFILSKTCKVMMKKTSSVQAPSANILTEKPLPTKDLSITEWEIPTECSVQDLEYLQSGRYGPTCMAQVVQADLSVPVIVKALRDQTSETEVGEFLEWIKFHIQICRHENLVKMLYCQTEHAPMFLVLEASVPGNLLHFLWEFRKKDIDYQDYPMNFTEKIVYSVARQVASGLEYLTNVQKLIHGDVAARNVVIGDNWRARICGLSTAFDIKRNGSLPSPGTSIIPWKWLAPERMMRLSVTEKSDVWSFGILLYEMMTLGSPPYPDLQPTEVLSNLLGGYRMKRPEHCGGALYDIMKHCWMWDPLDRPSYSGLIKQMDSYVYCAGTNRLSSKKPLDLHEYSLIADVICCTPRQNITDNGVRL